MSCAGGDVPLHYPPQNAFAPRWHLLQYPYPAWAIEFSTKTVDGFPSGNDLPIIMVSPDIEWDAPGFIFGLEWSSHWKAQIRYDLDSQADKQSQTPPWTSVWNTQTSGEGLVAEAGPQVWDLVLEPRESIALSRVHIVFFEDGFENASNVCRRYIRDCITPRYDGKPVIPPVGYTIWPGLDAPYTDKNLLPQVDAAADMGVEIFLLDAAWYPGDFPLGVGNWEVDTEKFPNGLEILAQYVRSKNMGFGMFFEPEWAAHDSKIVREHRDCFYEPLANIPNSRFQRYLYDLSASDAREYMIEMIGDFIEQYQLRYIRWDYNNGAHRVLSVVDPTGKLGFAHWQGLHYVWKTLLDRYPSVMLECCAGGGYRIDLGVLRHAHTCWFNDDMTHPHIYHAMQFGAHTFLPGYYMGSSLGWPLNVKLKDRPDTVKHPDAGLPDLSFMSRMAGMMMLHGRLADWPDEAKERGRRWIRVYKQMRHLLSQDYYRLLPPPQSEADWNAAQFCAGSDEGAVFAFRWAGATESQNLSLRAIDAHRSYLFRDEGNVAVDRYHGKQIKETGLPVSLAANSAKLLTYRAE